MKRNILNKIALLAAVTALISCKAHKHLVAARTTDSVSATAVTPVSTRLSNPVAVKLSAVRARQTDFNTFSGKAKAKLNINGNSNDVTLNIRIQKDQRIWVSITALLGVEVARALITPDSILVINRLQGLYLKKPFSYIYSYAGRQVNYKTVESLLVGNAIPELLNQTGTFQASNNGLAIISGALQNMTYRLAINTDNRVLQTDLANAAAGQSLQVGNSAFILSGGKQMPSHVSIQSMVGQHNIQAELNYNHTEFNQPQDYPFSIPSRFSPAD